MVRDSVSIEHTDLSGEELIHHVLRNQEGVLSRNGALVVTTGKRTGRSPKDRFIVKDNKTLNSVNWGVSNQPISKEHFDALWMRAEEYLLKKTHYISHLEVGADPEYRVPVKVTTELAWHALFVRNLFITPAVTSRFTEKEAWSLISVPSLKTDPAKDGVNSDGAVIIHLSERKILLVGMLYAGEMKKAMFSALNYFLPSQDVLPMHCAANMGKTGDVALFFGLSGTGKTTLSADPDRFLIGDDEHGWSRNGVFNFEGGCYAKCIDLSHEKEPVIWEAIHRGAIMENVILKENGDPDYHNASLTQNMRAAYPLEHITQRVLENRAGHPRAAIFLSCDLYGVLPPVALLNREQAAYYFLSGYTARVGSTEMGAKAGVSPTFSTCFGAPFFPRSPAVYAELLMKRLDETGCQVYLVNTGWASGGYEQGGQRFSIPITRAIIRAILNGNLQENPTEILPGFNLVIPKHVEGVENHLLNPKTAWSSNEAYNQQLRILIEQFRKNFDEFDVPKQIRDAGPQ